MRLATRSGLSLPRSECPFQDHLYGITVPLPASSLPPGAVPDPFGRGLLPSVPVSREPGRDHRLQPVAWLTLRSPASPQALLPFGTRPSGSPLGSIRRRGAYFSKRPVTFRSPPAATCYSTADGSTFQARLRLSKLALQVIFQLSHRSIRRLVRTLSRWYSFRLLAFALQILAALLLQLPGESPPIRRSPPVGFRSLNALSFGSTLCEW
jgi:hypothetical protein